MEPDILANCLYCHGPLYRLGNGHLKCSRCKRKISPARIQRDFQVVQAFAEGLSIRAASAQCHLSYDSVASRYARIRALIVQHSETIHRQETASPREFEEYVYLEAGKSRDRIDEGHNFITFDYGNRIYNMLLPPLRRFQLDADDHTGIRRLLRDSHIGRLEKRDNAISRFWIFFEDFILRYKGVRPENFGLYLKEAEFRFNTPKVDDVLWELWLEDLRHG